MRHKEAPGPTFKVKLPEPHPSQKHVFATAKRFNALDCGRRWGKTQLGIDRLIHRALDGKPVAWFAPVYKDLRDVFTEVHERLHPIVVAKDAGKGVIHLATRGRIDFWTLTDPQTGRGHAYKRVIIDEAAKVRDLRTAWEQNIRPQLTDYEGDAWFLSTPKGVGNYFYELYQKGQDQTIEHWASWQMPSATNPYLPPGEIESMRQDMTDLAFAQECLAQFVSWEGSVFRRIQDAAGPASEKPAAVIGVDWGRTNDYTVFGGIDGSGAMTDMDRFRGIEYSLQRARLAAFWERNGKPPILAESNSIGGPVIEQLQADGLPVKAFLTTAASKTAAIEALALAFERRTITILQDAVLIGELQAYEGKPGPGGVMRYGAPSGSHDDTVMMLAIAWQGIVGAAKPMELFADPQAAQVEYYGESLSREVTHSSLGGDFERPSYWRNI